MTKEYMLKRLVSLYNRVGVVLSINSLGVVRLHHDRIADDCFYPSVTNCYEITFGSSEIDSFLDTYRFYVCNPDGSTTPPMPV